MPDWTARGTPELSYGGYALLIPTARLRNWVERHFVWQDFSPTAYSEAGIISHPWAAKALHPTINYPDPPPVRFNTLYWPTGASRWGTFYGLITQAVKDAMGIDAKSYRGQSDSLDLVLTSTHEADGITRTTQITAPMYMLPPRPLSARETDSSDTDLWLLPLVDQRWWWQFKDTGELSVTDATTWSDLLDDIDTALGITMTRETTIDADYLQPDFDSLGQEHVATAALFDTVAWSIGQRVVVDLDATVRLQGWSDADDDFVTNMGDYTPDAGGEFTGEKFQAPATVRVSFPKIRQFVPRIDGDRYVYGKNPDAAVFDSTANEVEPSTEKIIHSTAYADFTGGSASPDNNTDLNNLAAQIATDYYQQIKRQYLIDYNGIVLWTPCAYDDAATWHWGYVRDSSEGGGGYRLSTHVRSMPHEVTIACQLQQDPQTVFHTLFKLAKADSAISSGGSGTVSIWENGADTGDNVTAYYDWAEGSDDIAAGDELWIEFYHDEDKWRIRTALGGGDVLFWGRTQTNWVNAAGNASYVPCKLVTGSPRYSSSTTTGANFNVYLPRDGQEGDPNVVSGDNIPFIYDEESTAICVGDYLDAKIGSVMMWTGNSATIPSGWAKMDGVANSVANGGSKIVMALGTDKYFPRACDTNITGTTGGSVNHTHADHPAGVTNSDTHTHTISGDGKHTHTTNTAKLNVSINVVSETVQVDISPHSQADTNHDHDASGTVGVAAGADATVWCGTTVDVDGPGQLTHTDSTGGHEHNIDGYSGEDSHNHTIASSGAHSHIPGNDSHNHSTPSHNHNNANHLPPFCYLYFIERLDNSV